MAEQKKKKRRRHSELEQFVPTADGAYVYTGEHMVFDGDEEQCRKAKVLRLGLGLLGFALLLSAGFFPAGGMLGSFYVLLPYAGAVLAAGMAVYGALRAAVGGNPLRLYVYQKTIPAIPRRGMAMAVLSVLSAAGEGLYMALNRAVTAADFAFLGLALTGAVCGVLLWRTTRRELWKMQEKN